MIPVHFEKSTVNWRKPGATFKCTTCGTTRNYHILITWLFFKLYGVPLLPLKRYASVIECDSCRNVFNPVPNSARNRADRINRNLGMVYGGLVVVVPIIWIGYLLGVGQRPLDSGAAAAAIAEQSVVLVNVRTNKGAAASGSGVIVGDSRHVLTNLHVVAGGNKFSVSLITPPNSPKESSAVLVYFDEARDLAVLYLDTPVGLPINVASSIPAVGSTLVAAGYPGIGGSSLTITRGTLSGYVDLNDRLGTVWLKTDAAITHGSSGGAALNTRGELIGIPTKGFTDSGTTINLALSVMEARDAIRIGLTRSTAVSAPPKK